MAITYEDVIPSLIENTTMQKMFTNGVHKTYRIVPCENYVLHDKNYDTEVIDPNTLEPTGEVILGYRTSPTTCPAAYDFNTNPRELYTVLATSVPADQIHGGGNNNDHEIM